MKSVLVPLDGSALSARAVPYAAGIARRGRCPLILFRALASTGSLSSIGQNFERQDALTELNAVAMRLRADGLSVEVRVVDDEAATAIVDAACPKDAALVVMSSHGRGGLSRSLYGSVADKVI